MEELFANSMQYNLHAEAIINIKIKDANNDVLIEVLDNGIGIREEEKEKIFEMFYKNEKSKGSGLGLYIVKNIVEKMKGSITLESYKNQGTKLQIIMPFIEGKQTC